MFWLGVWLIPMVLSFGLWLINSSLKDLKDLFTIRTEKDFILVGIFILGGIVPIVNWFFLWATIRELYFDNI